MTQEYHIESIPYGTGELPLRIPMKNYLGTCFPRYHSGVVDEAGEVQRALHRPIGSSTLKEIVKRKNGKKTVVVVNDGSRPTATDRLLPPLMKELEDIGIPDKDILILIATGTHRDVREDEFAGLLGEKVSHRYRIENHHCQDKAQLVDIGRTSQGVPVVINRMFHEADLKILTGSIQPHQSAGFSGGRKSVLPGLAGIETLKLHHGIKFRPPEPAMGWIDGNPFHLIALEAAKMAGTDFILNLVQNQKKQITRAVAGDVEAAWLDGVRSSRAVFEVDIPKNVDVLVVITGGHPKDCNFYQSQKSMAMAELVVKKGGTIILPAACPDGIGSDLFYEWMASASCPQDVIERFIREGFDIGTSKAWLHSRCLTKADAIVVSDCLDEKTLSDMLVQKARDLDHAIEMALHKQGEDAGILVLMNASDMIPK